ncbi:MAG: lactate racemase domain-containing protein [Rhodospirillales bacterium]
MNRRSFLGGVPLIGTALSAGAYQPTTVASLKGAVKSVVIPTHEFAGNLDERLEFPADWEINVMDMRGRIAPVLSSGEIRRSLDRPIGTKSLRELAEGKKTVAITFDDLTRATPTYAVTPWVVEQLKAAGIADENILFIGSFATHRPMTAIEVQAKLGKDIARRFPWMNHNVFANVREVGVTSFKNRVRLNQTFLAADLKICLSGIKIHNDAGYGGGAKAVLPGLACLETVEYNHNVLMRGNPTTGPVKVFKNEMRLDMIEAARMAKVDFSVQIMYNHKLQPTHVFSGDIVEAHHAGVRVAAKHYCTPTFKDADIVVTNGYPQNAQAFHAQRWIARSVREGGTGVLIIQHPLGLDPVHYLNNRTAGRNGSTYYQIAERRRNARLPRNSALIVYSQYMDRQQMDTYPRATAFADKWEDVIRILRERHKGTARVAVYPYGGMQHEELELDG